MLHLYSESHLSVFWGKTACSQQILHCLIHGCHQIIVKLNKIKFLDLDCSDI